MGHAWTDAALRRQDWCRLGVAIWRAGPEGRGRREAAELSGASLCEGLGGPSGIGFPRLRQVAHLRVPGGF